MKTQWSIINEILTGANAVSIKTLVNYLINLKWVNALSSFRYSRNAMGQYVFPLLKQTVKEAMGTELEIDVIVVLLAAYIVSAQKAVFETEFIHKIKNIHHNNYALPHAA
jgi:hypothetical protein